LIPFSKQQQDLENPQDFQTLSCWSISATKEVSETLRQYSHRIPGLVVTKFAVDKTRNVEKSGTSRNYNNYEKNVKKLNKEIT